MTNTSVDFVAILPILCSSLFFLGGINRPFSLSPVSPLLARRFFTRGSFERLVRLAKASDDHTYVMIRKL